MKREINIEQAYYGLSSSLLYYQWIELFPLPHSKVLPALDFNTYDSEAVFLEGIRQCYESHRANLENRLPPFFKNRKEYALLFFLNEFVVSSKPFSLPEDVSINQAVPKSLMQYLTTYTSGHCSHKPVVLKMLCDAFDFKSRLVQVSDLLGWSHGYLEVKMGGHYETLCPSFGLWMNLSIDKILEDPYHQRFYMFLDHEEYYYSGTASLAEITTYLNRAKKRVDDKGANKFKYNREWMVQMGAYPLTPPLEKASVNNQQIYSIYDDDDVVLYKIVDGKKYIRTSE